MNFTDQLQRILTLENYPNRIVSLVPSLTELLVDLGLGEKVLGLTKFCVHPKGFKKNKANIGGTKNFRMEVIEALNPDLIVGNKEENYLEGIQTLAKKFPVWMSDVNTLEEAYLMIKGIGKITGASIPAEKLVEEISLGFNQVFPKKGTAIYLIWNEPMMAAGKNTFIDHMLEKVGYTNLVTTPRYPKMNVGILQSLNPNYLLLSSEPFPFKQKHLDEYQKVLPHSNVRIVDGEFFSWYGSRLLKSIPYFHSLV